MKSISPFPNVTIAQNRPAKKFKMSRQKRTFKGHTSLHWLMTLSESSSVISVNVGDKNNTKNKNKTHHAIAETDSQSAEHGFEARQKPRFKIARPGRRGVWFFERRNVVWLFWNWIWGFLVGGCRVLVADARAPLASDRRRGTFDTS